MIAVMTKKALKELTDRIAKQGSYIKELEEANNHLNRQLDDLREFNEAKKRKR